MRWLVVVLAACSGDVMTTKAPDAPVVTPPVPAGCISDVSAGDHAFMCDGLAVDVRIPAACEAPGCGLILELHGDTGNGLLMDAHTNLRALGEQHGYIVVAPTGPPWQGGGPGSTWSSANDPMLVDIVQQFASVFRTDAKKIHVTGFSRGGFVCATGAAANETAAGVDRFVVAPLPVLTTGRSLRSGSRSASRSALLARFSATAIAPLRSARSRRALRGTPWPRRGEGPEPQRTTVREDDGGARQRRPRRPQQAPCSLARRRDGVLHSGRTMDPYAPQYAIPCELPNSFVWGDQVMAFFLRTSM